ncbi:MAG: ABC transporter substrate-binding protein [Symploca sp. SIO2G7]|nr:ABC transporter substrate-binding protein [Symploca sp. SIO2G7]
MKKMPKLLLTIVFTCLITVSCNIWSNSPDSSNQTPSTTPVDISLRFPIPVADTAFAPYYLGVDKGFFSNNGLNVKLEPGTPELNPVKMLSQGTDQFAVLGGPELLFTAKSKEAPLVGIALVHKNSDFVVVVSSKNSGITQLSDLQGKKIGFFYGHISTDILRMLFKKENVKVEEVDLGFDYSQLIAGKLPAQWAFRTTAGITLPAKGVELNFISPADYGIKTQGHVIVTTEKMIQEQPEVVQAFVNAVLEATAYSLEHPQESIEATVKRDPNFQPSVGEKQLEIYNAAIKRNSKIGWITQEDMDKTKEQMLTVDLIPSTFEVQSAYTTQFLEQYYKEK